MNVVYLTSRIRYKLLKLIGLDRPKISSSNDGRHFLVGAIEFMNFGDHAINIGEEKYFNRNGLEYIEIPESYIDEFLQLPQSFFNSKDVFYFHGGGNMGDVWPKQENWRQQLMEKFPHNKIIFFPQSVNYVDVNSIELRKTLDKAAEVDDLTVMLRDRFSFEYMSNVYKSYDNVTVELMPDMALTLNYVDESIEKQHDLGVYLRSDVEKDDNSERDVLMEKILTSGKYTYLLSDTVQDNWKFVYYRNREKFLKRKLEEIMSNRVIITDRLHGMVFAIITNRPVIVFDNNNHKIRNLVSTWLSNMDSVFFVSDSIRIEEVINKIDYFLSNEIDTYEGYVDFRKMVDHSG